MPKHQVIESITTVGPHQHGATPLTRQLAYERYERNMLSTSQDASLIGVKPAVRGAGAGSFLKLFGFLVLSPMFLVGSLGVLFFFPEKLIRKIMAPFSNLRLWERAGKRLFDILGAVLGFICLSVFFLLIPILIRFDSRGPIIYRQKRVGLNHRHGDRRMVSLSVKHDRRKGERRQQDFFGRPFWVYKFRTMRQNAEKASGAMWAEENDPRITRMGRILRFTHIDDIPQFFNVLC